MISFDFKRLLSIQPQKPVIGVSVSQLWILSIFLMVSIATLTIAIRLQPIVNAAPAASVRSTEAKTSDPAVIQVDRLPVAPSPSPAPVQTRTVIPVNCTPVNASAKPEAINLLTTPTGLTQLIDAPTYYKIFGTTPAQIQTQLQACAPHAGNNETFAGETSYALTWQYAPYANTNGLCNANNVKIGLHVTTTLPAWSATSQVANGLTGKWSGFINSLTLHETGHASLDIQYANLLLDSLLNYPATDCATLSTDIQDKVDAILADLDTANVAYDNHTNHGATQGAILP